MGISILPLGVPLAPDDVTSKVEGSERVWGIERARRGGRGGTGNHFVIELLEKRVRGVVSNYRDAVLKCDFDVTSSGANGTPRGKMDMPIVFSTLDNPKPHSFRESTFLSCARPSWIC
ncbi:hypothetical protein PENTCL1PPCAC_18922, partial [Pristionchus entomophagus]